MRPMMYRFPRPQKNPPFQLKIMQQRKLKPYDSTLAAVSISCSKALELDLAEALLEQISACVFPHPFNAFLSACDMMVS